MKKITTILLMFLFVNQLISQGISQKDMEQIRLSYNKNDEVTKQRTNVITNNELKNLILNRENIGKTDHEFKYKVSVKGITNQKQSGRCWMFTSLNVLRPKAMEKFGTSSFEFSTNYLYFWDIFEKANMFLEGMKETALLPIDDRKVTWLLDNVISDGGVWSSFSNLSEKYGLVPEDVMPETVHSENTRSLVSILSRKLREDGLQIRTLAAGKSNSEVQRKAKIAMMSEVYKLLSYFLGEPPVEFKWRYKDKSDKLTEYKNYTPQSYMKEAVGEIKFSDFVMLMDDPTRPYYQLYEIDKDRNVMDGKNWLYINIPASEIKPFAAASIKANEALYFSCDVGKQLNSEDGFLSLENFDYESLLGIKFGMNKKERVLTHDSGSTHGMALVGLDTDKDDKSTKWLLENSWGSTSGHNGYLTMTDEWFDQYMFRVVVSKRFVDEKTLKILEQKPVVLPPWDPMFKSDEN